MSARSSILAEKTLWTEETGWLQSANWGCNELAMTERLST